MKEKFTYNGLSISRKDFLGLTASIFCDTITDEQMQEIVEKLYFELCQYEYIGKELLQQWIGKEIENEEINESIEGAMLREEEKLLLQYGGYYLK